MWANDFFHQGQLHAYILNVYCFTSFLIPKYNLQTSSTGIMCELIRSIEPRTSSQVHRTRIFIQMRFILHASGSQRSTSLLELLDGVQLSVLVTNTQLHFLTWTLASWLAHAWYPLDPVTAEKCIFISNHRPSLPWFYSTTWLIELFPQLHTPKPSLFLTLLKACHEVKGTQFQRLVIST